jgi:hypothetical protein
MRITESPPHIRALPLNRTTEILFQNFLNNKKVKAAVASIIVTEGVVAWDFNFYHSVLSGLGYENLT